jgi:hypothetical protein
MVVSKVFDTLRFFSANINYVNNITPHNNTAQQLTCCFVMGFQSSKRDGVMNVESICNSHHNNKEWLKQERNNQEK